MKRTKQTTVEPFTSGQIQVLSELTQRVALATKLGYQYGTDRDLYQALGYRDTLQWDDYWSQYDRQDIAQAIIQRPCQGTWKGGVALLESDDDEETALEKEWIKLERQFGLTARFYRVDILTGLYEYGVLLLGLDDVKQQTDFAKPVTVGKRKLKYVKPYSANSAQVIEYESNPNNERYGSPLYYNIQVADIASGSSSTVKVHYSRVVHVVDGKLESEIKGTPRLKVVFNRLMDLEKMVGGDAEMFWRGARPGYSAKLDKDFTATDTFKSDLKDQIDEYEHNLRRMIVAEGMDFNALAQQIADPKNHVDIQIQMISAVTGIPKRILTGSERGELSSAQDSEEWKDYVQNRREQYAEPEVVRPFVQRLIELKILPEPVDEFSVVWSDLYAPSEKERVAVGKERALALQAYLANPAAEGVIPPKAFLEKFLGFSEEDIELMNEMMQEAIRENGGVLPGEENLEKPEEEDINNLDSEGNVIESVEE